MQSCTVCMNPQRATIETALAMGESLRTVARQFSVSKDALARHQRHQSTPPAPATAETPAPAAPSAFAAHLAALAEALRTLESCSDDEIERCYHACESPLRQIVTGMTTAALSRLFARQRELLTHPWDIANLPARQAMMEDSWREGLARKISR